MDLWIEKVTDDKKRYLDLLLLADEQESMIDRYLERGDMYVLKTDGGDATGVCVVTDEDGVLEIKNIAVRPELQRTGLGGALIEFIEDTYKDAYDILQVGTGDSPLTIPFYEKCGFKRSGVVKDFFTDNYDRPIFEAGVRLRDMVYLTKRI